MKIGREDFEIICLNRFISGKNDGVQAFAPLKIWSY